MTSNGNFVPVVLVHDVASERLANFFGNFKNYTTGEFVYKKDEPFVKPSNNREGIIKAVDSLGSDKELRDKKILTIYGDGEFHQYTYGLCKKIADKRSKKYTYVHIDAHDDYGSSMCCGAFVKAIEDETNCKNVRMIGPEYSYPSKKVKSLFGGILNDSEFYRRAINDPERIKPHLEKLIKETEKEIYVSIDLDVLKEGITTSWESSCGDLSLYGLLETISLLKKEKNIIGADILGYSNSCNLREEQHQQNLTTYSKIVDYFLK